MKHPTNGMPLPKRIPRPWDSPPGSVESRAAARALLEHAEAERERITIVCRIPRPAWDVDEGEDPASEDRNKKIRVGEWSECPDGRLFRMVYVPPGMEWPAKDPSSCVPTAKAEAEFPQPRPVELPVWEDESNGGG